MKKTVNMKRLGATELNDLRVGFLPGFDVETLTNGAVVEYPKDVQRPLTRGECVDGERPCPWVSCRYHLALDASEERDSLKVNFPVRRKNEVTGEEEVDFSEVDLAAMKFTCALDVAALRPLPSLEEFAEIVGLSYDRGFQVISEALQRAHEVAVEIGAAEGLPVMRKQPQTPETGDAKNDNAKEDPESNDE